MSYVVVEVSDEALKAVSEVVQDKRTVTYREMVLAMIALIEHNQLLKEGRGLCLGVAELHHIDEILAAVRAASTVPSNDLFLDILSAVRDEFPDSHSRALEVIMALAVLLEPILNDITPEIAED